MRTHIVHVPKMCAFNKIKSATFRQIVPKVRIQTNLHQSNKAKENAKHLARSALTHIGGGNNETQRSLSFVIKRGVWKGRDHP